MMNQHRDPARALQVRQIGGGLLLAILLLIQLGAGRVSAQSTPEATPLSEAIVDDVTIALLSWTAPDGNGVFEATVALTNRSGDPITIDPTVVLVTRNGQGSLSSIQLTATPGADCSIGDGERVEFRFSGEIKTGEQPERLMLGLIELHRSGGRVEFPLNGNGASAFGGSGKPGGSGGRGTPISGSNDGLPASATPGGATPTSHQGACGI
jgi:hypothetical protein